MPYGIPYNNTSGNFLYSKGDGAMLEESYNPFTIQSTGLNIPHNNLPLYYSIFMYRRIT